MVEYRGCVQHLLPERASRSSKGAGSDHCRDTGVERP